VMWIFAPCMGRLVISKWELPVTNYALRFE
jgi:hypothetical protein